MSTADANSFLAVTNAEASSMTGGGVRNLFPDGVGFAATRSAELVVNEQAADQKTTDANAGGPRIAPGPCENSEPIPGYRLRKRIGSGGFGEVWKAEAPGGLWKAIKFVYGTMDDTRASQELRSLEKIRDVHHPFLLSLERIEVVQGQLVVVCELAESCLKERFEQCRREGLPGIPRDELLAYLRDAADVLDYLYEKHSLQHLDVKPENLLLVGNHIKVADFGLLRSLDDMSKSVLAGLTPLYSPPEVLAGRPSRHSDQYSLAIVFQEMLTGEPPFAGRTTAQLAAQHLHSPPNLSTLPACDQPVVARALSKKPESRFASCRALIDSLQVPTSKKATASLPRVGSGSRAPRGVEKTEMIAQDAIALAGSNQEPLLPVLEEELPPLEPIVVDSQSAQYGPVIVVGLGGTGLKVLNRLRQKYRERLANRELPPAVRLLGIDTDTMALSAACAARKGESLRPAETFAIPLRSAASYRTDARTFLEWLERKWLYNIPRSLQTEGLRPYGRLAYVDNSANVLELLKKIIAAASSPESVSASQRLTGLPFRAKAPRVFLVASSSGGAGSGAVIDLAYSIRHLLNELQLPDSALSGFLVHATSRTAAQQDLAIANTCACLSELGDYGNAGRNYTAVAPLSISDFPENVRAFQDTYLMHLGDALTDCEYEAGLDRVADYLCLNTLTPAGSVFEQSRVLEHMRSSNDQTGARIRTMDLVRVPGQCAATRNTTDELVFAALLQYWTGSHVQSASAKSPFPELESRAVQYAEEKSLHFDPLLQSVAGELKRLSGCDLDKLAQQIISHVSARPSLLKSRNSILESIDKALGVGDEVAGEPMPLSMQLAQFAKAMTLGLAKELEAWLLQLLETPGARLGATRWATKWFTARFEKIHARAKAVVERTEDEIKLIRSAWNATVSGGGNADPKAALDSVRIYCSFRIQQILHRALQNGVVSLMTHMNNSVGQVRELADRLNSLAAQLYVSQDQPTDSSALPVEATVSILKEQPTLSPLVMEVDRTLSIRLAVEKKTFAQLFLDPQQSESSLAMVREIVNGTSTRNSGTGDTANVGEIQAVTKGNTELVEMNAPCAACVPLLSDCGGAQRLVVVAPETAKAEGLSAQFARSSPAPTTVVQDQSGDLYVCCEVEQVPLTNVLAKLVGNRSDILDVARRLHTRCDVSWSL